MAFNAYLVFHGSSGIKGESTSVPDGGQPDVAIEITDYGFGVSMPVTTSRSDGGGATVGRANFDVFTASKGIDTATVDLVKYCCKGTNVKSIVLHLYRAGGTSEGGTVKYAMVVFHHCVITKCGITGSGEELPKESLEFNYGRCEYIYQLTKHDTGAGTGQLKRFGWTTIKNVEATGLQDFNKFLPDDPKD
ncbi:MAG TPA: type VI secretion system tube protein Hcp [Verrucomicrobiae bacterium]|nr:type VI secretion system tube protein Hcp [Verrucomicrobiae bacterium]